MDLFNYDRKPLRINKPIRLIELFAGIGSQAKALERLGADFEHYRVCEFDKYAIASYNAIHDTDFVTSDITQLTAEDLGIVDTDKYCYIMTYSFPCQDLSLAGKQKGMAKGENTRSGLLWEVERLLSECTELPQILLMENVTQVHGKKNKEHFDEWIAFLESKGYSNYWKDLNAKNFGIPQNRNRTFMVSVLGDYTYEFPQEFPLELRLKDMLEDSVDEKFYISNEKVEKIVNSNFGQEKAMIQKTDVCGTLLARDYKDPKCVEVEPIRIGGLYDTDKGKHQAGAIWDKETIAPTVDTMQGGNRQPLVTEEPQERFFRQALETLEENDCSVGDTIDAFNKKVNKSGTSPTVTTRPEGFKTAILPVVEPLAYDEQNGYIRKDGTVGTLTTDGSSPKHNNRVIENCYVSEKGVRFICSPKRGMATDVNADICQPLTAKGQANWTGSFVSPDIENLEKSSTIGSTEPTKINLKNGETVYFDGVNFSPEIIREEPLEREGWHGYAKEVLSVQGVCRTLSTQSNNLATKVKEPCTLRIRKLTPKECWRLMGFDDADFEKAAQHNSNSQLYKQAGNSIVVDVLYHIFGKILWEEE